MPAKRKPSQPASPPPATASRAPALLLWIALPLLIAGLMAWYLLQSRQAAGEIGVAMVPMGRGAEAVEGDEVSATLLTELHAAIAESRARPPEARERCLRRFVEAWLVQQRETYDADRHGGDDS